MTKVENFGDGDTKDWINGKRGIMKREPEGMEGEEKAIAITETDSLFSLISKGSRSFINFCTYRMN